MQEPTPRASRLALAGGVAAAILFGGGGFLLGRGTTERPPAIVAPAPVATPAPQPVPEPDSSRGVLGRADLIALAASAADASATGRDSAIADADGRRFELRVPFGCGGPAAEGSTAAMRWRYADGALRIHVAPVAWDASDWWAGSPPDGIDTIEGFWIMRPWTASEDCPVGDDRPAAVGAEPVTLPGQTLAIGQIFAGDDARDGRRDGQPYASVMRVAEDELDTSRGFRVRLSGRIARTPGGTPVRCQQPAGAEQRPICLIGAVIDEVAIENPATGETLATWDVRQRDAPAR